MHDKKDKDFRTRDVCSVPLVEGILAPLVVLAWSPSGRRFLVPLYSMLTLSLLSLSIWGFEFISKDEVKE